MGWCDKRIDNDVDVFGSGGECLRDSRPHTPSASGADGDVGVGMLCSEDKEWVDRDAINVENVMCAGEAGEL